MGFNITGGTKESPLDQDIPLGDAASGATRLWEQGVNSLRKESKSRHHFLEAKRFLGEWDNYSVESS